MADEKKEAGFGKKFRTILFAFISGIIGVFFASYCVTSYINNDGKVQFSNFMDVFNDDAFWNTFTIVAGLLLLIFLIVLRKFQAICSMVVQA